MTTKNRGLSGEAVTALDDWEKFTGEMGAAMGEIAGLRANLDHFKRQADVREATLMLEIQGGNAEARKAMLVTACEADADYQGWLAAEAKAKRMLADADMRFTVARERARICRAVCALLAGVNDGD